MPSTGLNIWEGCDSQGVGADPPTYLEAGVWLIEIIGNPGSAVITIVATTDTDAEDWKTVDGLDAMGTGLKAEHMRGGKYVAASVSVADPAETIDIRASKASA